MTRAFTFAFSASLVVLLGAGIVGAQSEPQAKPTADCCELPGVAPSEVSGAGVRWARRPLIVSAVLVLVSKA